MFACIWVIIFEGGPILLSNHLLMNDVDDRLPLSSRKKIVRLQK